MVRVTIKSDNFDKVAFEFAEFEVASDFLNLALIAAAFKITVEIEKVADPAEGQPEEPKTRFPEPEEVPAEELASAEEYF